MQRAYPMAQAARRQAPYNIEFAFGVPSVQVLLISSVSPSSSARAIGRPAMATPTSPVPLQTPTLNLWPRGGRLCRCFAATKARASLKVIGRISKAISLRGLDRQRRGIEQRRPMPGVAAVQSIGAGLVEP